MKNVILITIDTLRRDVFGCYGSRTSFTPFMDSVQSKCLRFEKAYATGPYTQASFPGILTSSYYLEYGKQKRLPTQKILISEVLKKNGIKTAAFHSNPYLSDYFGYNRGWDTFYDSMEDDVTDLYPFIRGAVINKKVDIWLANHTDDIDYAPFFMWIHYMDVHEPYVPEKEYISRLDPEINLTREEMFALFKDIILKRDVSNNETVELLKKLYLAKVLEVDDHVRALFNIFKKNNILKDSVVIFASDHGDEFNEHGGLSHDGKMYSELIAVPLFIYFPEKVKNEVYDKPVSNIDISPTIVYLFGIECVDDFKGCSLLPVSNYKNKGCFGEAMNKRGHKEKDTDKPIRYYLNGDLKIVFDEGTGKWELYNLNEDPFEKKNIIETADAAEHMRKKLLQWTNNI